MVVVGNKDFGTVMLTIVVVMITLRRIDHALRCLIYKLELLFFSSASTKVMNLYE